MIRKILMCDRCGTVTEVAYRIKTFTITADDVAERDGKHLGENTDYCPACLRTIATLADTAPLPDVAAEMQRESELTVPEPEQVEEAPVEAPAEPTPKRYRAKTLYLMSQAGKSIDQIAEETGYTPEEVYKKLKKFKEGQNADN